MANSLYQAILDKVRKVTTPKAPKIPGRTPVMGLPDQRKTSPPTSPQGAPDSSIIPFAPGRIYRSMYTNWHHDPRPLIFILSSNAFYTHAINIHYLETQQRNMMKMIKYMKDSGMTWTGMMIYKYMKQRFPAIPEFGYRLYFTKYLKGKLVSNGISNNPIPGKAKFFAEPFIKQLNEQIGTDKRIDDQERDNMREAQRQADIVSSQRS